MLSRATAGLIITEATQSTSFDAMSTRQQKLAEVFLKDPDVDHIASFIGVDGANTTLNTGRLTIPAATPGVC